MNLMKFKTTAIAMAVAGTVAAPVAVQAGADEIYASARVGIEYAETAAKDAGGTTVDSQGDTQIRSVASRFGARGETDLGNGLTGFGRYEWGVDFNNDDSDDLSGDGSITTRHRYVGLKGDFGSALVGQTYHTFYNFVVGGTDVPWVGSGFNQVAYVGRTDNGLTYAGSSDAFAFGVTLYMNRDQDEETVDVYEVGGSFTFGNDMTLGLAYQGTEGDLDDGDGTLIGNGNDEGVFGAMLTGVMLGDSSWGFGTQAQDDDYSFLVDAGFNNFYAHVEYEFLDKDSPGNSNEDGDDQEPVMTTIGYNQPLGRKTQMYYEAIYNDADTGNSDDDGTWLYAVLKYDII
jgi:predicted porin